MDPRSRPSIDPRSRPLPPTLPNPPPAFLPPTGAQTQRVFVGNLAWTVSWRELKDHMKTAGLTVSRADVLTGADGRSKGCGIVEFDNKEAAKQAVSMLNDSELMGRQIFVREVSSAERA